MFLALFKGYWVLSIVHIDSGQLIYYDPLRYKDTEGVMRCAKECIAGEVQHARRTDVLKGLDVPKRPEVRNTETLPRKADLEFCRVFAIHVAEHLERVLNQRLQKAIIQF